MRTTSENDEARREHFLRLLREGLERGGTGRGTYWNLRPDLYRRLSATGHPERDRRIDWKPPRLGS